MSDHVLVAAPAVQARERLLAQVRRDGLRGAVADALTHGKELRAPLAEPVQGLTVRTLPTYRSGAVTVIPLRWYTNLDFDDRFPVVDANLELEQAEPGTSRLSLTGIYHPATGQPGGTLTQDDTPAAIRRFLGRLADILAPGQPRTPQRSTEHGQPFNPTMHQRAATMTQHPSLMPASARTIPTSPPSKAEDDVTRLLAWCLAGPPHMAAAGRCRGRAE